MKKHKGNFCAWAKAYGAKKLAADLGVIPRTVYWWLHENESVRTRPRPKTAQKIVALSKGALKLADILAPQEGARV